MARYAIAPPLRHLLTDRGQATILAALPMTNIRTQMTADSRARAFSARRRAAAAAAAGASLMFAFCGGGEVARSAAPTAVRRPEMYTSDAIRARVLDARTKQPVAGAAIVAIWRKIRTANGQWNGVYRIEETTSGEDGAFAITRWGPRPADYDSHLDSRDPEIWVLRRGYLLGYFDNEGALDPRVFSSAQNAARVAKWSPAESGVHTPGAFMRPAHAVSAWNGKVLELHRSEVPEVTARALIAAAPYDTYEAAPRPLPLFWSEWLASRDALGPMWQERIQQPLPLMHRPSQPLQNSRAPK